MKRKVFIIAQVLVVLFAVLMASATAGSAGKATPNLPALGGLPEPFDKLRAGSSAPSSLTLEAKAPLAPLTPTGSGFTYQGSLKSGGNPANGSHDFTFKLFNDPNAGSQVGSTITATLVITGGLFTAQLDFGTTAFQGDARWLEIAVRQTGGGGYTLLSPRQPLSTAPYALSLMPGAVISSTSTTPLLSAVNSGSGYALFGSSSGDSGTGVYGYSTGDNGVGVVGYSSSYVGVSGYSNGATGVGGYSPGGFGVSGGSSSGMAVYAESVSGTGVYAESELGTGVYGHSLSGYAMYADGHGKQTRDKGGWAKALVHVSVGSIDRCYNSQGATPNTTAPCGFTITQNAPGDYTIGFGFQVNDRFVSVTPEYGASAQAVISTVVFPSANTVRVRTFTGGSTLIDSAFFLIIY